MKIDMWGMVNKVFSPVLEFLGRLGTYTAAIIFLMLVCFVGGFFILSGANPFRFRVDQLRTVQLDFKAYDLIRWMLVDFLTRKERVGIFNEYGFTVFVGRQGSGKTISMVAYLERMRERYPECLIATNFHYEYADYFMDDWRDFFEIRNGTDGVIFAIDEIQNEYSADAWKDFPETLLSEITMQRKQRIKIVTTAQVFSRIAKPIREQTFSVVFCKTFLNRFTLNREYDAAEYATSDSPYLLKKRCKPIFKTSYVQSDKLRNLYDTYEKVQRMGKQVFIPRSERK